MEKKFDRARSVAITIALLGILVTLVVARITYNQRYDSSAQASGGVELSYSSNDNSEAFTLTASAGSVWYGAWQKSGKSGSNTYYSVYYKKTSDSSYSYARKIVLNKNGSQNAVGDWRLARSNYSQKYDVRIKRTTNTSTTSVLRVDWAVDSYNSTGS